MNKITTTLLFCLLPFFSQATVIPLCGGGGNADANAEDGIEINGTCGILNVNLGTVSGNITITSGGTLTINGNIDEITGNIEICPSCTVVINGDLDQVNGSVVNGGNLTISGTLNADGALTTSGTGTTTLAGGDFSSSGSKVEVQSGGMLMLMNGATIDADSGTEVEGTLTSDGNGNVVEGGISGSGAIPPSLSGCGMMCVDDTNLPVDLTLFTSDCDGSTIHFRWETAIEVNNDYFTIEASIDGIEWQALSEIPGAGTIYEAQKYSFKTETSSGRYFRLVQYDLDGTRTNFEVVAPGCGQDARTSFNVFPNPSHGAIEIALNGEYDQVTVDILNTNGSVLSRSQYALTGRVQMSLPEAPGIYTLRIQAPQLGTKVQRIVKY